MSVPAVIEAPEQAREQVRQLLPELPAYIENCLSKLNDDKDFEGRVLTSEEKSSICRSYARTGSINRTCDKFKMSAPTLYRHLEMDRDFRNAFSLAKFSILDDIQSVSVARAKENGGVIDRMCQLKRLAPSVYKESPAQVAVGVQINLAPVSPA